MDSPSSCKAAATLIMTPVNAMMGVWGGGEIRKIEIFFL